MKKGNYILNLISIFLLMFLMSCVSTQRPFKNIYIGETEHLLTGTRWELRDLKSTDNFMLYVEFNDGGTMSWYNIPDSYNAFLSENSTWERSGNDLIFNARDGFYLYEGRINNFNEEFSVVGRYKTGYARPIKTHPTGDFNMTKQ